MKKKEMLGKTFSERVVEAALSIPPGRVTTYGRLARACGGGAMASQSITTILGKAYAAGQTDIPFHRIVYARGSIWVDEVHRETRMKLYRREKIVVDEKGVIRNFNDILFEFT
jgi:methylated-DNA-protein-cysteine methyltransferase-like protein